MNNIITVIPFQTHIDITPKQGEPWYQFKKDFWEYWSCSKFKPTFNDVFIELKRKGIPSDFKGKGKRNRKK